MRTEKEITLKEVHLTRLGSEIAQEREYYNILENAPLAIIRYDCKGYISYINVKLASDLGVMPKDVIGKLPNEAWPDKRFDAIQQAAAQVLQSETEAIVELVGPANWNGPTSHKIHILPERNSAGDIIGTVAFGTDITAEKQYAKSLLECAQLEDKLSGLAASVESFIFTVHLALNGHLSFTFASDGIEKLVGLRPEEFRYDVDVLFSRFHPDDLPHLFAQRDKSKKSMSLLHAEVRVNHPDHGMRWVEIRSTPQRLDDGSTRWHGMMLDITERKALQAMMQKAQHALEEAQRIAHIGSWDVDLTNDRHSWSDETYRIWEIDKSDFASTFAAFIETVHPEDREKVTNAYNKSIIDKTIYQVEHRLLFPDGRVKHIKERGEPLYSDEGKPIRFIGTSLDITEQKKFEGLVSLQNHALDIMGEAVFLIDEDGRIHHVNNAACKMLGYTVDELMSLRVTDFDSDYNPDRWKQHWQELLEKKTITLETTHRDKNGGFVLVEVNANVIEYEGKYFNFALARDITERKRIEAQLHHQASYDILTGLPNRRLFDDKLKEEVDKAQRTGKTVSLLFIDLDRFKEVNDTLGHYQGDQILIEAANRIQQCMRSSDALARMGGDEFVVALSGVTEMSQLGRIAQDIIETLRIPFVLQNQVSYLTASVGIANYPLDTDTIEGLISAADQAMYAAKQRGRNGFSFFTPAMQVEVQERLSLANDLREALLKGQLEIYLQPIIDVKTGRVVKAEALTRWSHPQHGMVPPDKFIPIAEETGLIHEIGDWVFQQAGQAMSRWLSVGSAESQLCQISVNMSARQFTQIDVGINWVNYLKKIGVAPEHMAIEITESLLLGDELDIMKKLNRLREAGINLALDDFGTGYSAMLYLKKFKIDFLKIDRSFVCDLETDPHDRALAEAIVVMAHKLGLKTIAEGVETENQKAILAEVGCDYLQGYLYAKPMPVEDFISFVQQ